MEKESDFELAYTLFVTHDLICNRCYVAVSKFDLFCSKCPHSYHRRCVAESAKNSATSFHQLDCSGISGVDCTLRKERVRDSSDSQKRKRVLDSQNCPSAKRGRPSNSRASTTPAVEVAASQQLHWNHNVVREWLRAERETRNRQLYLLGKSHNWIEQQEHEIRIATEAEAAEKFSLPVSRREKLISKRS